MKDKRCILCAFLYISFVWGIMFYYFIFAMFLCLPVAAYRHCKAGERGIQQVILWIVLFVSFTTLLIKTSGLLSDYYCPYNFHYYCPSYPDIPKWFTIFWFIVAILVLLYPVSCMLWTGARYGCCRKKW